MWRSKIESVTLAVFIAIGGMVVTEPSYAVTLVGTTNNASGIDGLVIDSVTYDVTFVNGSYNSVYTTPPTFLGNDTGAGDATTALIAALKVLGVTNLVGLTNPNYYTLYSAAVPEQYPVSGLVAAITLRVPPMLTASVPRRLGEFRRLFPIRTLPILNSIIQFSRRRRPRFLQLSRSSRQALARWVCLDGARDGRTLLPSQPPDQNTDRISERPPRAGCLRTRRVR